MNNNHIMYMYISDTCNAANNRIRITVIIIIIIIIIKNYLL